MKRFFVLLALLVSLFSAQAEGPDDQYVRIYNLIQQADTLQANGKSPQALSKYLEAQSNLQRFQKTYPDWNVKVVTFRLSYLSSKVAALSGSAPHTSASPSPAPNTPADANPRAPVASPSTAPTRADFENQVSLLRDQTRQLQAEKQILEAKLREALAAQPATVDAKEFLAQQEKVKALQKENDSLKAAVADQSSQPAMGPDSKSLQRTQQLLAEANRKLNEQTEKANTLALEKQVLQAKLDSRTPGQTNATTSDPNAKALAEANSKLARLAAENESLQSRVKKLNADVEVAAALRAENQLLKRQLAEYKIAPTNVVKGDEPARKLAEAQTQIAALQSDKELLRLEKQALENRMKQMAESTPPAASPGPATPSKQEIKEAKQANARIKQLEDEKATLQKKLDAALKTASSSKSRKKKGADAAVAETETQLANLRARLDVFEAKPVPFSAEELALFRSPNAQLAKTEQASARTSVKELPPGTAALVAEAQRHFSNREFDKAEEKYLQVLRQDQNNVYTLANLAAIELERNSLDEAEKHIKQAVTEAPDDGYSLSILGYLKFRQEKYDDAFDALSRAAQINPQSAEIQNFLGLTLSHKGMRIPAETALRKAIQLEPGYASAHNNLAVIYLTQQPPQVELARWHYQKALTFGHPHNPDLEKMLDQKRTASNP